VALSSDSKSLVLAGDEKKLILKPLVVAVSHHVGMGNANVMTVHPSNGQVITAGTDKIVRIWDPTTKKEIKVLEPLPAIPTHLVISQDGTRLAASAGKLLRVWSVSDSKNFSQSEQHASIIALRFTNDPSRVLIGFADRRSARYNLEKQSVEEWITNPADVLAVVQHPQQPQSALSISKGKTVTTLPLIALKTQRDEKNQGKILMITPNGSHLLTAGKGEGPVALNASSLGAERTFALKGAITAVAVTKNVQVLAAAMADPPRIALYQFGSGQEIGSFPLPEAVSELQFHPTQLVLFGRSSPNTLTAWDVSFENGQPIGPDFGKAIQQFPHSTPLRGLTLSVKGDQLLTVSTDRLVRHWGFASLTPSASLGHPNRIDSLAFHPTEPLLATGCADGIIRVWDLNIPQPTTKKTITAHQRTNPNEQFPIYAVKWSPDGKRLASGSLDKSIKVWDAESTKLIFEIKPGSDLPPLLESTRQAAPALASTAAAYLWKEARPEGHTDAVYTLDYSPDGKLLASGSSDHMIKIWNAETGTLLRSLTNPQVEDNGFGTRPAHPAFVHKLAFNSQGNRLVSVGPAPGNNGFLAIWNPLDGTILKQTALRIGQIHGVAWTSDSQLLLGCGPQSRTQLESAAYVLPYKE
jgi:WD40 repeat protein